MRLDGGVGGRHDLHPAGVVELVAVVARRVVAGRDHDAGVGLAVDDGVRRHRCGHLPQEQRFAPGGRDDRRRVGCEDVGVPPSVVPDHHPRARRQGGHDRGGGRADHHAVHPRRARPQRRPQAGGAEPQPPVEEAAQLFGRAGVRAGRRQQGLQFGPGVRVGVGCQPRHRCRPHGGGATHGHARRLAACTGRSHRRERDGRVMPPVPAPIGAPRQRRSITPRSSRPTRAPEAAPASSTS